MSKVWGITMIKNEEDIIEYTLLHMISEGLDGILVSDNMSIDHTARIVQDLMKKSEVPIIYFLDRDPGYRQSRKMTWLAMEAHKQFEADWIVPFDADEIWYHLGTERVGDILRASPAQVLGAKMWNHFETRVDSPHDVNPFTRMKWRYIEPNPLDKVCFQWQDNFTIMQGNHGVTDKGGNMVPGDAAGLAIRHFPYRGVDHFIQKAIQGNAAYKAAPEVPESMGVHWRQYAHAIEVGGREAGEEIYNKWFSFHDPTIMLTLDPAPWRRFA